MKKIQFLPNYFCWALQVPTNSSPTKRIAFYISSQLAECFRFTALVEIYLHSLSEIFARLAFVSFRGAELIVSPRQITGLQSCKILKTSRVFVARVLFLLMTFSLMISIIEIWYSLCPIQEKGSEEIRSLWMSVINLTLCICVDSMCYNLRNENWWLKFLYTVLYHEEIME